MKKLSQQWNGAFAKLILIGQLAEGVDITRLLVRLTEDPSVIVMTETTSNIHHTGFIHCIDRVIDGLGDTEVQKFKS